MAARTGFILQASVLLLLTVVCGGFLFDKAVISPADALVFIGETLRVKCTLKSNAGNILSSSMYIKISYTSSSSPWIVPQENTTIVDNKTILAVIEITDSYSSYTTIYCMAENKVVLNSKGLYVERPIQNITKFSGVYFVANNSIVTTWSLGETYLHTVNVDTDWNANLPPNLSGNSCNSSTEESCVINYIGQGIIFIRIKVWVSADKRPSEEYLVPLYDTQATSVHMFVTLNNLKTGPPQSVTVIDTSSVCVNISWKNPEYFNSVTDDAIFRFEIKVEDEAEFRVAADNVTRSNSTQFMQLCQLIPYTRYFLSVRIKARMVNPWSDPAIVEFFTEEDRPLTGPPLNDTSYYTGECVKNEREVFLYWNDPSKSSLQGQLTRYEIVSENMTQLLRAASNYYTANLDCDSTYEILVYSATKVGLSLRPSSITIPRESEELTVENDLMFRVEITSEASAVRSSLNISVTWAPGDLTGDTSLILYMCQETYLPNTCLNEFTTTEVSVDQRNMVVNDIPVTTNLFGYSLRDKKGEKRGIKWTSCVFRADLRPVELTKLDVTPGSHANSLLISWTPLQCSKTTKVLILKYHLYICLQSVNVSLINGSCLHVIRNVDTDNYCAKDLKGGRSYYVYIQAESPAGLGRLYNPVVGIPSSPNSPDTETIIGAVFGTASLVFILGLSIFCLARQCAEAKKRVEVLKEKFEWPKTCEFVNKTYDQDNNESGIYTDSAPNSTTEIISENLELSVLSRRAIQQFLHSLAEKHTSSAEEINSIAEDQQFLDQQTGEDSRSRDPKGEDSRSRDPKGEDSRSRDPKGEDSRSRDPKAEDSNPSADLNSQQFADYFKCGTIDSPYISSQEVLLRSRYATDREIDNPDIFSQEVLLPSSTNTSNQSLDSADSSLGRLAPFQEVCDPYLLLAIDDTFLDTDTRSHFANS